MLRSIETINRNMNVLQKLENTTSNIANLNTQAISFKISSKAPWKKGK